MVYALTHVFELGSEVRGPRRRRRWAPLSGVTYLVVASCFLVGRASAQEAAEAPAAEEPEAEESEAGEAPHEDSWAEAFPLRLLLGAKTVGSFGDPLIPGDKPWGWNIGAAVYGELELIRKWLNLELGGSFVAGPEDRMGRFEPYLKMPFEVSGRVELYWGAGPTLGTAYGPEGRLLVVGGAVTVGGYYFFRPRFALDYDFTFELASAGGNLLRDFAFGLGCVTRVGELPED